MIIFKKPLLLLFGILPLLFGCSVVDFKKTQPGDFSGTLMVVWVDTGFSSSQGDGEFLFIPYRNDPLTFRRPEQDDIPEGKRIIAPQAFYTDGGSIPRFGQSIRGLNAWGYGPAYVIHDWLFVARRCLNDKAKELPHHATKPMEDISYMDFKDSVEVMAETIKTIHRDLKINEPTGQIIPIATSSNISRDRWTAIGTCGNPIINPKHQEKVDMINSQKSVRAFNSLESATAENPLEFPDGVTMYPVAIVRY